VRSAIGETLTPRPISALIHEPGRAVVAYRSREVREILARSEIDSLANLREWARMTIERLRRQGTEGGCVLGALVGQLAVSSMLDHIESFRPA
jgi:hypothetical protein